MPNLSLQLFSYLTDLSDAVQGPQGEGQCMRGILMHIPAGSLQLQGLVWFPFCCRGTTFNIPGSEVPALHFLLFRRRLDVLTLHVHKHQTIDLQHMPPRWLISFKNERRCQRAQIITVSTLQKHILIQQQN